MTTQSAYKELVTKHGTIVCDGKFGRVSVRKTCGHFRVRLERYEPAHTSYEDFKTIRGALLYLETAKGGLV